MPVPFLKEQVRSQHRKKSLLKGLFAPQCLRKSRNSSIDCLKLPVSAGEWIYFLTSDPFKAVRIPRKSPNTFSSWILKNMMLWYIFTSCIVKILTLSQTVNSSKLQIFSVLTVWISDKQGMQNLSLKRGNFTYSPRGIEKAREWKRKQAHIYPKQNLKNWFQQIFCT